MQRELGMTTFTETTKRRGITSTTEITVTREPATLSEHRMLRHRWFDYVGDAVTACFKVTATFKAGAVTTWTNVYFEIVTATGRGVVSMFDTHSEIDAFIPNNGSPALAHGCWKKYGMYRGHCVGYLRANHLSPDSRKRVEHTCPAKIYAIAAGRPWG